VGLEVSLRTTVRRFDPYGARLLTVVLVGVALWCFAANLRAHRCAIVDDAFISFRFATNVAHGAGFVWNPGESPVEGASNLLLVLVLAVLDRFGVSIVDAARILAAVSSVGCAALIAWLARPVARRAALLTGAVLLVYPATAVLAMEGLETTLYALTLTALVAALVRYDARPSRARSATIVGCYLLVALSRPEAPLVGGVMVGVWAFARVSGGSDRAERAGVVPAVAGAFACAVLVAAWKYVYFGTLLSPPYWVKHAAGGALPGAAYDLAFLLAYAPVVLLAVVRIFQGSLDAVARAVAVTILVQLLVFLRVAPVMAAEGRYLFPTLPLILLLAAPTLERLLTGIPSPSMAGTACLGALVLLAPQNLNPPGTTFIEAGRLTMRGLAPSCTDTWTGRDRQIGQALRDAGGAGLRVVAEDVGAIGFLSDAAVLDPVGLTDMAIARADTLREFTDRVFGFGARIMVFRGPAEGATAPDAGGGHGALGRFGKAAIFADPRFASFELLGSGPAGDPHYRWYFWASRDFPGAARLLDYADERVAW
jgi:hypothetical protein